MRAFFVFNAIGYVHLKRHERAKDDTHAAEMREPSEYASRGFRLAIVCRLPGTVIGSPIRTKENIGYQRPSRQRGRSDAHATLLARLPPFTYSRTTTRQPTWTHLGPFAPHGAEHRPRARAQALHDPRKALISSDNIEYRGLNTEYSYIQRAHAPLSKPGSPRAREI